MQTSGGTCAPRSRARRGRRFVRARRVRLRERAVMGAHSLAVQIERRAVASRASVFPMTDVQLELDPFVKRRD